MGDSPDVGGCLFQRAAEDIPARLLFRLPQPHPADGGYWTDCIVGAAVIVYSVISYFTGIGGWSTECMGFLYGLIFAYVVERFQAGAKNKWLQKMILLVAVGLMGGVSYEIYLLHRVIFSFLSNLTEEWNSGVFVICAVLLTIAAAVAVRLVSTWVMRALNNGVEKINRP